MSSSVLRDRLGDLGDAGFVQTDHEGRYELTPEGLGLLRALGPLSKWADDWGGGERRSPLSG